MASTEKTTELGLNLWAETDKPERIDFVSDNQKLEELVGAHLKAKALHLTADEKERAKTPFQIFSYPGDGRASLTYYLPFEPRLTFLFATHKVDGLLENGLQSVFRAMKFSTYVTPGISGAGARLVLTQQTEEQAQAAGTGYRLRLNEKGVNYCGVIFR